ncbi:MAG: RNA polymerase sigma factor [Bacteroidales bacterium]|nr:RNA polymerase sigma factor [Bacteroidales bacterium]
MEKAYADLGGYLLAVCRRYVSDADTSQDLFQDGFVAAYTHFHQFSDRGKGSLKAWLTRIMVNTCLQYLRKGDLKKLQSLEECTVDATQCEPPAAETVEALSETQILEMIAELPIGERTVFNMYVFEDYSQQEIARALGIKRGAVAMRYQRARNTLASKIRAYEKQS